jgi:hypothetical protein
VLSGISHGNKGLRIPAIVFLPILDTLPIRKCHIFICTFLAAGTSALCCRDTEPARCDPGFASLFRLESYCCLRVVKRRVNAKEADHDAPRRGQPAGSNTCRAPGAICRCPRRPTDHLASQPPESGECRLVRINTVHRVSRQSAGLAARRLEQKRLVIGNHCPSKNRNIPDGSTVLAPLLIHVAPVWRRTEIRHLRLSAQHRIRVAAFIFTRR